MTFYSGAASSHKWPMHRIAHDLKTLATLGLTERPAVARQKPCLGRNRYWGREMPTFFIFKCNIERFIPRRAAAPLGPPTTQRVSRRAPRI